MRASFQQQLQQMLLTMLALWIPLLPLLLLVFRAMDSRNGTAAKRRNKSGPNTPRVTFADVAGRHDALLQLPLTLCVQGGSLVQRPPVAHMARLSCIAACRSDAPRCHRDVLHHPLIPLQVLHQPRKSCVRWWPACATHSSMRV